MEFYKGLLTIKINKGKMNFQQTLASKVIYVKKSFAKE